jgi:hypothetical protein
VELEYFLYLSPIAQIPKVKQKAINKFGHYFDFDFTFGVK